METHKTPATPKKTYINGKQIEIVCRLCAKTDSGCTNVFSKVGEGKNLAVIIENLTGIGISAKDTLPKTVCRVCQRQLSSYMNFKNKCLEVQSTLSNVTVKRCKEISPQPTAKRIHSENRENETRLGTKINFGKIEIDEERGELMEKFPNEATTSGEVLRKEGTVNAGLIAYHKNEVSKFIFLMPFYQFPSMFSFFSSPRE